MSATPIGRTAIRPGLFGGGLFGGIAAAGFLGAGLLGLLFGQGFFGGMAGFEAAAGRSSGSLARRRYRLCDRGDEICAEGQHGRARDVGSAGVLDRGKGTGWIVEPERSRSRPRESKPTLGVVG